MKIAFATQDMKSCNAHFGSAKQLAIYEVSDTQSKFLEAVQFEVVSEENGEHQIEGDDKLQAKIDALQGCHMLFVLAIGGPAAARVVNNRVHPVKLPRSEDISDVIGRVQTMMQGTPPPWMRKILMQDKQNMDFLEEEDCR